MDDGIVLISSMSYRPLLLDRQKRHCSLLSENLIWGKQSVGRNFAMYSFFLKQQRLISVILFAAVAYIPSTHLNSCPSLRSASSQDCSQGVSMDAQ